MAIIDRSRWIQIGWFAGLWITGVAAVSLVAYGLRWLLHP